MHDKATAKQRMAGPGEGKAERCAVRNAAKRRNGRGAKHPSPVFCIFGNGGKMEKVGALNVRRLELAKLLAADYNPRKELRPGDPEWEKIARSIRDHDYADPIIVNRDGTIIGGHQRRNVMLALGYTHADCVVVDLDKTKEKTLNVALNKITGDWDADKLRGLLIDLNALGGMDAMTQTGFDKKELNIVVDLRGLGYDKAEVEEDGSELDEDDDEYAAFVDKFKPKLTTDDCYTPPEIFDTVRDWACREYGIREEDIVRPFFPGGDYENFDYPEGCVVLDNPPFSIVSKIQ